MNTNLKEINESPIKDSRKLNESSSHSTNKFVQTENYLKSKYNFRYNKISLTIEGKLKDDKAFKPINENDLYLELNKNQIQISLNNLLAILKSSFVKEFDPLKNYFESLPEWNWQTDYIGELCSFVNSKNPEQFYSNFKKWLVRVVATALDDYFFNKQAFILVHKQQNSGKSTFCRFLCPQELSDYIAEDITFDKDSRILLAKNVLINLDELSTLSRVDVNKLKSWFSKDKINERLPYDRKNSIINRRCSFMGSTNLNEFLTDETGSVRWLCFEISGIDWSYKQKVNINSVYSQAYALYKSGTFNYNMTKEEIQENEIRNKDYEVLSLELELIAKHFKPDTELNEVNFKTATDITSRLIYLTDYKFKLNKIQIGKALVSLGYERARNKKKIFGYYIQETFIN